MLELSNFDDGISSLKITARFMSFFVVHELALDIYFQVIIVIAISSAREQIQLGIWLCELVPFS